MGSAKAKWGRANWGLTPIFWLQNKKTTRRNDKRATRALLLGGEIEGFDMKFC